MPTPAHRTWPWLFVVLAALIYLFTDTLRWLCHVPFSGPERRLNLALLLLFAILLAHRLRRLWQQQGSLVQGLSHLRDPEGRAALALLLASTLASALMQRAIGANTLTAVGFLAALYGLLGLFLAPAHFRAGLSGLLLLVASLPFAALAEGYAGLLARIFTAEIVQQLLSALHIAALPVSSILILERGIAHIDIPCSGLRGLWSGVLAYLLLTWIERRRLGLAWLAGLVLMQALLVLANISRVFALVLLAHVAAAPQLAEHLHAPLGLFGFALCIAAAFFFLRYFVRAAGPTADVDSEPAAARDSAAQPALPQPVPWLLPTLAGVFLGLCLLLTRAPATAPKPTPLALQLPADLSATPLALTAGERAIFERFGAHAEKLRIPGGSLIIVQAPTLTAFRAHHPPEVCMLASAFA
jgi:exosortase O